MAKDDRTLLKEALSGRLTPEVFTSPSSEEMSARIHSFKISTRNSYGDDDMILANEQAALQFITFVRLAMILRHPHLHPDSQEIR